MQLQTQYNLLNRIPELEVLPAAQDFGIGVIAYMPLAVGHECVRP